MSQRADIAFRTVAMGMNALVSLGVAHESTGRLRDRVFAYQAYLDILNKRTEAL